MPEYIMFPVPAEMIPEVARFVYGSLEAPEALPSEVVEDGDWNKLATPEQLKRIYMESEPKFRKLMLLVAERDDPMAPISYEEVTTAMGWTSARSLPGALGAYGRRSKHRYEGAWPMNRDQDPQDSSWSFSMPQEMADEIIRLHAEHDLPTTLL